MADDGLSVDILDSPPPDDPPKRGLRNRVCRLCKFTTSDPREFLHHMNSAHDEGAVEHLKQFAQPQPQPGRKNVFTVRSSPRNSMENILESSNGDSSFDASSDILPDEEGFEDLDDAAYMKTSGGHTRTYRCSQCSLTTTNATEFLHHQVDDHDADFQIYECPICNYATKYKQKLGRHVKVHSPAAGRPVAVPSKIKSSQLEMSTDEGYTEVYENGDAARNSQEDDKDILSNVNGVRLTNGSNETYSRKSSTENNVQAYLTAGDGVVEHHDDDEGESEEEVIEVDLDDIEDEDEEFDSEDDDDDEIDMDDSQLAIEEATVIDTRTNLPVVKKRVAVEPWKYVQIHLEKGRKFACTACGKAYSWRKSVNKHWKDKHPKITKPENLPTLKIPSLTVKNKIQPAKLVHPALEPTKSGVLIQTRSTPAASNPEVLDQRNQQVSESGVSPQVQQESSQSNTSQQTPASRGLHNGKPSTPNLPSVSSPLEGKPQPGFNMLGRAGSQSSPSSFVGATPLSLGQYTSGHKRPAATSEVNDSSSMEHLMQLIPPSPSTTNQGINSRPTSQGSCEGRSGKLASPTHPLSLSRPSSQGSVPENPFTAQSPSFTSKMDSEGALDLSVKSATSNKPSSISSAQSTPVLSTYNSQPQDEPLDFSVKSTPKMASTPSSQQPQNQSSLASTGRPWTLKCKQCQKNFVTEEQFNKHFHEIHMPNLMAPLHNLPVKSTEKSVASASKTIANASASIFKCQVCKITYPTNRGLSRHMYESHPTIPPQHFQAMSPATNLTFRCNQCHFVTKWSGELEKHKKTHARIRCSSCGFSCPQKMDLRNHIARYHPWMIPASRYKQAGSQLSNLNTNVNSQYDVPSAWSASAAATRPSMMPSQHVSSPLTAASRTTMAAEKPDVEVITLDDNESQIPSEEDGISKIQIASVQSLSDFSFENQVSTSDQSASGEVMQVQAQDGANVDIIVHKCRLCDFRARWPSEITQHMKNHSDEKPYQCPRCSYYSKWKWDIVKHMKRCGDGCGTIHDVVDNTHGDTDRIQQQNQSQMSNSRSPGRLRPTVQQLLAARKTHALSGGPPNVTVLPSGSVTSPGGVYVHTQTTTSSTPVMNQVNATQSLVTTSQPLLHGGQMILMSPNQYDKIPIPRMCVPARPKTPPRKVTTPSRKSTSPKFTSLNIGGQYHCLHCPFIASCPTELKKHAYIHTEEYPFKCSCGQGFKWRIDLKEHTDSTLHVPAPRKPQVELTEVPSSESWMTSSAAPTLPPPPSYPEAVLAKNVQSVGDQQDNQVAKATLVTYKCDECQYVTYKKHLLEAHQKIHKQPGRPTGGKFKCKRCDFQAQDLSTFLQHRITHSSNSNGNSPIKPLSATGQISQISNPLPQAMKITDTQTSSAGTAVTFKMEKKHRRKPLTIYKCPKCPYKCFKKSGLELHEAMHEPRGEDAFVCDYCDYNVYSMSLLSQHMKLHVEYNKQIATESQPSREQNNAQSLSQPSQSATSQSPNVPQQAPSQAVFPGPMISQESSLQASMGPAVFPQAHQPFVETTNTPVPSSQQQTGVLLQQSNAISSATAAGGALPGMYWTFVPFSQNSSTMATTSTNTITSGANIIMANVAMATGLGDGSTQGTTNDTQKATVAPTMPQTASRVKSFRMMTQDEPKVKKVRVVGQNNKYQCPRCPYTTRNKGNFDKHVPMHYKHLRFVCEWCDLNTNRLNLLYRHALIVHPAEARSVDKKEFFRRVRLKSTRKIKMYKMENEKMVAHSMGDLTGNLSQPAPTVSPEAPPAPPISPRTSPPGINISAAQANAAVQAVQPSSFMKTLARPFHEYTPVTTMVPQTRRKFQGLSMVPQTNTLAMEKSTTFQKKRKFRCNKCNYITDNLFNIRRHVQKHGKGYRYQCKFCDYSLDRLNLLCNHVRLVHGVEDPKLSETYTVNPDSMNVYRPHLNPPPATRVKNAATRPIKFRPILPAPATNLSKEPATVSTKLQPNYVDGTAIEQISGDSLATPTKPEEPVVEVKVEEENDEGYGLPPPLTIELPIVENNLAADTPLSPPVIAAQTPQDSVIGGGSRTMSVSPVTSPGPQFSSRTSSCTVQNEENTVSQTATAGGVGENKPITEVMGKHQCPRCPYVNKHKESLLKHIEKHEYQGKYKCPYCDYSLDRKNLLDQHLLVHGKTDTGYANKKKRQRKPVITQPMIQREIKRRVMIAAAQKNESTEVKTEAKEPAPSVRRDAAGRETGESKPKTFREFTRDLLSRPTVENVTIKSGKSMKHCFIQEAEFFKTGSHIRVRYRCPKCPFATLCKKLMLKHRNHHISKAKYVCEICGYAAKKQAHLVKHKRLHDDNPDFQSRESTPLSNSGRETTPISGAESSQDIKSQKEASGMEANGTEVTGQTVSNFEGISEVDINPSGPPAPDEQQTQMKAYGLKQRTYKCRQCPFSSNSSFEFRKHAHFHGAMMKYLCDYCSYSVDRFNLMFQHRKMHMHESKFDPSPPPEFLLNPQPGLMQSPAKKRRRAGPQIPGGNYRNLKHQFYENNPEVGVTETENSNSALGRQNANNDEHSVISEPAVRIRRKKRPFGLGLGLGPRAGHKYQCSRCPYMCRYPRIFRTHVNMHGYNGRYKCDYCDWSANRMNFIMNHRKVHRHLPSFVQSPRLDVFVNTNTGNGEATVTPKPQQWSSGNGVVPADHDPSTVIQQQQDQQSTSTTVITAAAKHGETVFKPGLYPCKLCPFSCDNVQKMYRHRVLHSKPGRFSCNKCSYSVGRRNLLYQHQRLHQAAETGSFPVIKRRAPWKTLRCASCPYHTHSRLLLDNHLKNHTFVGKYRCKQCGYSVDRLNLLHQHQKVHAKPHSGQQQQKNAELEPSTSILHGITGIVNSEPIEIARDSKPTTAMSAEIPRMGKHTARKSMKRPTGSPRVSRLGLPNQVRRPYKCDRCPYSTTNKTNHEVHITMHGVNNKYGCPYCDFSCHKIYFLAVHIRLHFPNGQLSDDTIKSMAQCSKNKPVVQLTKMGMSSSTVKVTAGEPLHNVMHFNALDDQHVTMQQTVAVAPEPAREPLRNGDGMFVCQYCDRLFEEKEAVQRHEKQHLIGYQ